MQDEIMPACRAPLGAGRSAETSISRQEWLSGRQVSLAEVLDRVLNKGAVVVGEMTISVAGIDLIYLGINVLLTSVDTIEREFEKSYAKKLYEIP